MQLAVYSSCDPYSLTCSLNSNLPTSFPYYDQGEIAYMWLSLFAKGVLGLLVLSNVLMLGSFTEIYEA